MSTAEKQLRADAQAAADALDQVLYIYTCIYICIYIYIYVYIYIYIFRKPRLAVTQPARGRPFRPVTRETGHTHTTTRQEQHHKQITTTRTNPPTPHSTPLKGGATTVRATSHARVGGRAEVSVGGRIELRRGLGRARVRHAPAGPLRSSQLEASRGLRENVFPM